MAFSEDIAGTEYVAQGAQVKRLPIPAGEHPDFRLLMHPARWGWFESADHSRGEWLPMLRRMILDPGVGNVDKDGDPSLAIGLAAQDGWACIYPSEKDPYIKQYPATGGVAHLMRWERVKLVGNRAMVSSDDEGYRAWLRDVCKRNGWTPDPDVIALKRAELEAEQAKDASFTDASSKVRANRAAVSLALMDGRKLPKVKEGGE